MTSAYGRWCREYGAQAEPVVFAPAFGVDSAAAPRRRLGDGARRAQPLQRKDLRRWAAINTASVVLLLRATTRASTERKFRGLADEEVSIG